MGSEFLGEREPQSSEGLLVTRVSWGTLVSTRQRHGCLQLWMHTNPSAPLWLIWLAAYLSQAQNTGEAPEQSKTSQTENYIKPFLIHTGDRIQTEMTQNEWGVST